MLALYLSIFERKKFEEKKLWQSKVDVKMLFSLTWSTCLSKN